MTTLLHPTALPTNWTERLMRWTLARLLIALLCVMPLFMLTVNTARWLLPAPSWRHLGPTLAVAVGYAAYCLYVRKFERRRVSELALNGAAGEFGRGLLIGAALFCAAIGALAALGAYHVTALHDWRVIGNPLLMELNTALFEELLMRAIFFRLIQRALGSWLALLLSGLLFGAMHLGNPNASLLGASDAAVAGMLFAAAFMLTGRLWISVGLHAGWNFFQGGIFSVPVSGQTSKGLLEGTLTGPDWLTGGAYGVEASAVALTLLVLATALCMLLAKQRAHITRPFWARA